MEHPRWQRALAEFVATFAVVFIAVGAVVAGAGPFGGGDTFLLTVAVAYGLAVAALMTAVGHVSGGHLNPALTVGAFITGRIELRDAVTYVVAQLAGAAAAAGVLRAGLPSSMWESASLGVPGVNIALSTGQAVLVEAVVTFVVSWVFFATVLDRRAGSGAPSGMAVGLAVVGGVLVAGPLTGGALNPARALGPALAGGYWDDHWVHWIGPVAGAVVAAFLHDAALLRPRR